MSRGDWSRIAKEQDEYVLEQDRLEKLRKAKIQENYKNQLLRMIHDNESKNYVERELDRKIIRWAKQKEQYETIKQMEEREKKKKVKQEIAKDNFYSLEMKKNRVRSESQQVNKFYQSKFRKLQTEVKVEMDSRLKSKESQKQLLSEAYQNQIKGVNNRKVLQKMEDQRFTQLLEEIERKKEQDRKKYFIKLRNNFRQNPEVYEQSKSLKTINDLERINFIEKLADQKNIQDIEIQEKQKGVKKKMQKFIQVSQFNRNYFQAKSIKERLQRMQEKQEYSKKLMTIGQEIEYENEQKRREKEKIKLLLQNELEKQINESHLNYNRHNKLSQQEEKINKSLNIGYLPGLAKDYSTQKKYRILENFVGVRSTSGSYT